jgi:hypothetical protein
MPLRGTDDNGVPSSADGFLHGPFMGLGINGNPLQEWSRTLSSLLECLVTLQKVACTTRLATVCLQGLMRKNGDLISEHWVGL